MSIFDEVIDRNNTRSLKYDEMDNSFGRSDLLPLWVADMDFKAPQPVLDALHARLAHGIFGYASRPESYNQAFIDWHRTHNGFDIQHSQIIHSPTVVASLSTLLRVLTHPGDAVIIQPPVYYPFKNITEANSRVPVLNPLKEENGRYTFDLEDLAQKIETSRAKVLLLCNPHNPVGRVWSREELLALHRVCHERDVLVISDEIHGDFALWGNRYIPFATLNEETQRNTITCLSTSKTFNLAGLQSSFIVIPQADIREKTAHALYFQDIARNNSFSLEATEAALLHGNPWLQELKGYLEENMAFLIRYSEENLPGFRPNKPEGTYLVWIDVRDWGLSQKELERFFINEAQVAMDGGGWFGIEGDGFMRMNVACPRSVLEEALERIRAAAEGRNYLVRRSEKTS